MDKDALIEIVDGLESRQAAAAVRKALTEAGIPAEPEFGKMGSIGDVIAQAPEERFQTQSFHSAWDLMLKNLSADMDNCRRTGNVLLALFTMCVVTALYLIY